VVSIIHMSTPCRLAVACTYDRADIPLARNIDKEDLAVKTLRHFFPSVKILEPPGGGADA